MLFSGRYVVLLMGAFSIFTGLVYNEMFAKPLSLFGANNWIFNTKGLNEEGKAEQIGDLEAFNKNGRVYPFGMDPVNINEYIYVIIYIFN